MPVSYPPATKGEMNFVDQFTRRLMVDWANTCIQSGELPLRWFETNHPYSDHALEKGWVGKREPRKLTSKGWATAAAFLKR